MDLPLKPVPRAVDRRSEGIVLLVQQADRSLLAFRNHPQSLVLRYHRTDLLVEILRFGHRNNPRLKLGLARYAAWFISIKHRISCGGMVNLSDAKNTVSLNSPARYRSVKASI